MVKFQEYWVKKHSKPGRGPYKYRGILLRIPKKCHSKVDSFLGFDLEVKNIVITESKRERMITIIMATKKGYNKTNLDITTPQPKKFVNFLGSDPTTSYDMTQPTNINARYTLALEQCFFNIEKVDL